MVVIEATKLHAALDEQMTPESRHAVDTLLSICAAARLDVYLVGGAVRDLALGRGHVDLDLCIEGEVAPIAQALAAQTGGKAVTHARFGTATVSGLGFSLDLARTRREAYTHPGALPEVEPAAIEDDLARRDFTINAMALRLSQPVALIDLHRGMSDLETGLVRALHERSFEDDATRILRAIRYVARLGMQIEPQTLAWLRRDLPFLDAISGARLRRELTLIFEDESAPEAALFASELGVLQAIDARLDVTPERAARWREALHSTDAARDELGFCLIAASSVPTGSYPSESPLPSGERVRVRGVEALAKRLSLTNRAEKAVRDFVRLSGVSDKLATASPWQATELLDGFTPASIVALSVVAPETAGVCEQYLSHWHKAKAVLRGHDLAELGVKAGAAVGETLKLLRRARIEGRVASKNDEIELVRSIVTGSGG